MLYGCSLLYGFTGSTNFEVIKSQLNTDSIGSIFAMVFIIVGLAFKVSAVPFHMWTPDVYEGSPTSVTSFFAVAPKIAGLAVIIKFMLVPFSKYFNRMAINYNIYICSLDDTWSCRSNRTKKY